MNAQDEIMKILRDGVARRSLDIKLALTARGLWFAEVRMWPALRALERAHKIERKVTPGGPERGGYPVFWFRRDVRFSYDGGYFYRNGCGIG